MRLWDSQGVTFLGGFVFSAIIGAVLAVVTDSLLIWAVTFVLAGLVLGGVDRAMRE